MQAGPAVGLRAMVDAASVADVPVKIDVTTSIDHALATFREYRAVWDIRGVVVKAKLAAIIQGEMDPAFSSRLIVRSSLSDDSHSDLGFL